jgi:hypothetical protein
MWDEVKNTPIPMGFSPQNRGNSFSNGEKYQQGTKVTKGHLK